MSVRDTEPRIRRELRTTEHSHNGFPRVAVIGAGISGLTCARTLTDHGVAVTVFEKSRGVGGRMATRRAEGGLTFDHGAQYFTVGDEQFGRHVRSWQQDGLVQLWDGTIRVLRDGCVEPLKTARSRFVGTPGMTAVCKHLAKGLDVHLKCEVAELRRSGGLWCPVDAEGRVLGTYDVLIVSSPSVQSARLLEPDAKLSGLARQVTVQPCWAVMAVFDSRLPTGFDGAFIHDASLSWAARNSSKPARSGAADCWVLHGSPIWSRNHLEATAEEIMDRLLDDFWAVTGQRPVKPRTALAHRWRYALPVEPLENRCLLGASVGLGACGDWCGGPRVEGAFLSGLAAAERVLRSTSG